MLWTCSVSTSPTEAREAEALILCDDRDLLHGQRQPPNQSALQSHISSDNTLKLPGGTHRGFNGASFI